MNRGINRNRLSTLHGSRDHCQTQFRRIHNRLSENVHNNVPTQPLQPKTPKFLITKNRLSTLSHSRTEKTYNHLDKNPTNNISKKTSEPNDRNTHRRVKSSVQDDSSRDSPSNKDMIAINQIKKRCGFAFRRKNYTSMSKKLSKRIAKQPDTEPSREVQEGSVEQYLKQYKMEQKQFKQTLEHFDRQRQTAFHNYNQKVQKRLSLAHRERLRRMRQAQVDCNYTDQVFEFHLGMVKNKTKYKTEKNDVYHYFRARNKILNPEIIKHECKKYDNQLKMDQYTRKQYANKRWFVKIQNQRFYKRYLKHSVDRKDIIHSSLQTQPQPEPQPECQDDEK